MTMASKEHLKILMQGAEAWNRWREENLDVQPDLSGADLGRADLIEVDLSGADLSGAHLNRAHLRGVDLSGADLGGADLVEADLSGAHLRGTYLSRADLRRANLSGADLGGADLSRAKLSGAHLSGAHLNRAHLHRANLGGANLGGANLVEADLSSAHLRGADLRRATLSGADLSGANLNGANLRGAGLCGAHLNGANLRGAGLCGAHLSEADLSGADLILADLSRAHLSGADLREASLVKTNLAEADLTGCLVYGISAWNLNLEGATQSNLVISDQGEPIITVDNLRVAQFIYLLLNNEEIRDVIDTITSKVVLILGRFTPERKAVLDALREELRRRDYLSILFDFEKPSSRDLTETISTLAHMARFVIADITDAKSIPQELQRIVPDLPSVPVQPLIATSDYEYGMFEHFRRYPWVLETYQYDSPDDLLGALDEKVISPAESKAKELTGKT
jgi:uncharacterized protein YjbI with pentapeptide repeats